MGGDAVGLGIVIRDNVGDLLMSAGRCVRAAMEPKLVEALAVLFGLKYAFEAGFRSLIVESDCSNIVDLLQGKTVECSASQVTVNDILALASTFNYCSFYSAHRSCNKATHSMAKVALSFREDLVWMEDGPHEVVMSALSDKEHL
ncbi:uncharacterized protein LOC110709303 [Chenopodium quinoa]|uniref:uncharacterized protein LOC110709303 n=1 Tax=Chenopodium quinoa TaxID=63459 RepID=UPI000B7749CD|nr:uncharacterized protein LOC110709303 [Chenopodium quinoa]